MNKIDEKNEDYQIKNVNNTFTEKESWGDRVADASHVLVDPGVSLFHFVLCYLFGWPSM